MKFLVYAAGLVIIAVLFTALELRSRRRKAEAELHAFAATVPAPMTPEVREWLAPQLARRSTYPVLGSMWGLVGAHALVLSEWGELPWYWFIGLLGAGVGASAGTLVAGLRTAPLVDGPRRAVDPVRRRTSDYYQRSEMVRMRLAVLVSAAALAVAAAVAVLSATTATFATVVSYRDLPVPVLLANACTALLVVASVVFLVLSVRREKQRRPALHPSVAP